MTQPTKKKLEKAIKATLFSEPENKTEYVNKKPTQNQLSQKWKFQKRGR